jgi:hypothetical protein
MRILNANELNPVVSVGSAGLAVALCCSLLTAHCHCVGFRPGSGDWPMWGGTADRNMVSNMKGLPTSWDVGKKTNVKWVALWVHRATATSWYPAGWFLLAPITRACRDPKVTGDKVW